MILPPYTTVLLVLLGTGVQAQDVSIGVKGGLTIPNITPGGTKTPLSEGYSSRLAWGAGAFADFQITNTFSLQVGLEYSEQGGQKDGMQAMPSGLVWEKMEESMSAINPGAGQLIDGVKGLFPDDYLYSDFESKVKFNYLMVPVQAKFGWNLSATSPVRFYVSAGVFGSCLMSAERISTGSSAFFTDAKGTTMSAHFTSQVPPQTPGFAEMMMVVGAMDQPSSRDETQTITDDIKSFNFGVIGAVGFSYSICNRHKVFIEGGGNYGLVKIQKDDANGQNRIGSGSVMLGYSFTL